MSNTRSAGVTSSGESHDPETEPFLTMYHHFGYGWEIVSGDTIGQVVATVQYEREELHTATLSVLRFLHERLFWKDQTTYIKS